MRDFRMRDLRLAGGFARLDTLEGKLCGPCNSIARFPAIRLFFKAASRLGDGVAWYVMLAVLPIVFGTDALAASLHMALTALVGVGVYKLLKESLVRERPFFSHAAVEPVSPPLDRYSFPSGHTMHAVAFLVMLAHYFPAIMLLMLPFGISVALSRVILGLHYPSDVVAGGLIGFALAHASLALRPLLGV